MRNLLSSISAKAPALFKKRIFNNFFYLILLQASNFIFPLLLIPYLVKTIGYDKVGLVFFAQSLMSYFIMVTDYGFNLTATQQISVNRENKTKIAEVINAVLFTKLLLLVAGFVLLSSLIFIVQRFRSTPGLFYFSFLIVVGQTFSPNWFFLGLEKMRFIAILSFAGKLSFLILVFFFIKDPAGYIYVNFFLGVGNIIVAILMCLSMYSKVGLTLRFDLNEIKYQLKEGWLIFVSGFAINMYMSSNIFILGFYVNKSTLGYYSIAEKCYLAIRSVLGIFSQVIYPRVCNMAESGINELKIFYRKIMPYFLIFLIIGSISFYLLAPYIVFLFSHAKKDEIVFLARAFSALPLIVALNIPPYQIIVVSKLKNSYGSILISASILNILLNIFLAKIYGAIGTIASIYVTELFVTIGMYLIIELKHRPLSIFFNHPTF